MISRYNGVASVLARGVDIVAVMAAWMLAYWLRFEWLPVLPVHQAPDFTTYASLAPVAGFLWLLVFTWRGLYHSRRMTRLLIEFQQVVSAHVVAMVLFVGLAYFIEHYKYSRLMLGYFGVIALAMVCGSRAILRLSLRALRRRGRNTHSMLVVGMSDSAVRAIAHVRAFPELGVRVRGIAAPANGTTRYPTVENLPVLGDYGDVQRICTENGIREVLIAVPQEDQGKVDAILDTLRDETISIRIIPDVTAYATLNCTAEDFDGMPVVRINDSPLDGFGAAFKRTTDILGALAALILFSPIMIVVGALVKLTSPGPMFYAQERMGLDGRAFKMYKFRSMKVDVERISGAQWCTKEDDRRTAIGTFIRKTSLDELPQLWNVLRGDMALVGPRPERPVFVQQFRSEIPNYMLRHKVKTGITGWAQVNGWRGDTSLERRIECDIFYIRNWSLLLDARILAMTVWSGFVNKNAY